MLVNITFAFQSIFFIYGFLSLFMYGYSINGNLENGFIYFLASLASFLIIILLNIFKNKINNNINYLILNFFIIWMLIIFVGAIPLFSIYENNTLSEIIFLSTSISTTTGFLLPNAIVIDSSMALFWKAIMQYIGAKYTIISYLLFFIIFLIKENKSFFLNKKIIIYFNLTFLSILLLYTLILCVLNDSITENFSISSAILSSGGVINLNDSILNDKFTSDIALIVLMILMLFSLFFFPLFIVLIDKKLAKKIYRKFFVKIQFILMLVFMIYFVLCFFGELSFVENIFLVTSFITTTGILPNNFEESQVVNFYTPFFMVFILLIIIGTFSGTSNGGLKIDKISLIIIKIKEELNKFIYQHNIKGIEILKKGSNQNELNSLYALIAAGSFLVIISIFIQNLIGVSVRDAFIMSIGSLTNTGEGLKLLSKVELEESNNMYFILNLLMICGRFENIGFLLVIMKLFRKY